jgi:predicted acyltransferase
MSARDQRLDSLDLFRGLTVAGMILVSTPGNWDAVYWPLNHAAWNGWTPTDLVFPFFLFAMGAAVPVALAQRRGLPRDTRRHVLMRAAVLFAVGLLLNVVNQPMPLGWSTFRIPGVLQRIAIVYVAVVWLTERTTRSTQALVATIALTTYWIVMTQVPVPGVGAGVLTPAGNLASFLDRLLLRRHLAYAAWDPEGILSTVPAMVTALCGVFATGWLLRPNPNRYSTGVLFAAGVLLTLVGLLWAQVFPLNKNLWTSSFALFTAGLATQLLALCQWRVDMGRLRGWTMPFVAFGRNALAAYLLSVGLDALLTRWTIHGSGVSLKWSIYSLGFASWGVRCCGEEAASLFYALVYVALCGVALGVMYRQNVFIRI